MTCGVLRRGNAARWRRVMLWWLMPGLMIVPGMIAGGNEANVSAPPPIRAFGPGERLSYRISWSRIFTAGVAVMEVGADTLPDGEKGLLFTVTARSVGIVNFLFHLREKVESVFDPQIMESLSYSLTEIHGRKTRRRVLVFDHARRVVVARVNEDPPTIQPIPEPVQDALSAIYVLRTKKDFAAGMTHVIEVHDSGKNWSVQFRTLGRETVNTAAGEFQAIKISTHARYKGVFLSKGEISIWLTDDDRKVPVLIKSKLSIGSIVLSLNEMKLAGNEE